MPGFVNYKPFLADVLAKPRNSVRKHPSSLRALSAGLPLAIVGSLRPWPWAWQGAFGPHVPPVWMRKAMAEREAELLTPCAHLPTRLACQLACALDL